MHPIQKTYSKEEISYLTHNFHPYPDKLIPQIAKHFIQKYTNPGDLVFNPFCGSGTVLLESNLLGRDCIGIDLNPLACLISRVKITTLNPEILQQTLSNLLNSMKKQNNLNDFLNKPTFWFQTNKNKYFQDNILQCLKQLKHQINNLEGQKTKEFFLLALSSTLKPLSNTTSSFRLRKLKSPPKMSHTQIQRKFREKSGQMISAIQEYNNLHKPSFIRIIQSDLSRLCIPEKVDFILAILPRLNPSFISIFKIYFSFFGWEIKPINKNILGTKDLETYYKDMENVLTNLYNSLKPGKHAVLRTKDLQHQNQKIPHTKNILTLAKQKGFSLESQIEREIPTLPFLPKQKESYMVLRK